MEVMGLNNLGDELFFLDICQNRKNIFKNKFEVFVIG